MFIDLKFSKKLNNGYNLTYTYDTVEISALRGDTRMPLTLSGIILYTKLRKWATTNIRILVSPNASNEGIYCVS